MNSTTPNEFDHAIGENINQLLDALQHLRAGVYVDHHVNPTRSIATEQVRLLEAQISAELLGRRSMLQELEESMPSPGERDLLDSVLARCWGSGSEPSDCSEASSWSTERGRGDPEGMINPRTTRESRATTSAGVIALRPTR